MADQTNRGGHKKGSLDTQHPEEHLGVHSGTGERTDREKQQDQRNNPDDERREPTDQQREDGAART